MNDQEEKESFRDIVKTCKNSVSFALKEEPGLFIFYFLIITVSAVVVYLQLTSFSDIINEVVRIQNGNLGITRNLINKSVTLGVYFLIPSILNNIEQYVASSLRIKLRNKLDLHLVESFSNLDIATLESSDFQKKLEFAQQWGLGSILNVVFGITRAMRDVIGLIVSAVILALINPLLVLLAVLGGIPGYFISKKYQLKMFRLYHEQTDDTRIVSDRRSFFTNPKKLVEVLLFNLKSLFKNQLNVVYKSHAKDIIKVSKQKALAEFGEEFFNTICLLVAIGYIIWLGLSGSILIGSLFLAFTTYRGFVSTTNGFFFSLSQVEEQTRYAIRWFDLFSTKARITNVNNSIKPSWNHPPQIEFKNVSFSYPGSDKQVLKNISFIVGTGEKLALVGLNGAGKTTLVKLLCRVYDPTEGVILINGIDLRQINIDYWRSQLGVLFQDFSNFNMTAAEAIAAARPHEPIDMDRVAWAAEVSGAAEFIREFPKQYEQLIWKGFKDGVELSKGQFQRMAVARIFYRNALISVLDEPTASIDAVAEEKIFESLEKKMENKTVILISHRFSTVKNADKIAVVEHGQILEFGNHKELVELNGRYAELYAMQASRYLDNQSN